MNINKKRIIMIQIVLISFVFIAGITYSIYTSEGDLISEKISIANFIFNANKTDNIELPINNLVPGGTQVHEFSVSNNLDTDISDVTVEYQIKIKTLHTVPYTYEVVYLGDVEEILITCNDTVVRNDENMLECKSKVMEMTHVDEKIDNYELRVTFPPIYNDAMYANKIDYVDIEIDSWQKLE